MTDHKVSKEELEQYRIFIGSMLSFCEQINLDLKDNENQIVWPRQMVDFLTKQDVHWYRLYEHEYGVLGFVFKIMKGQTLPTEVETSNVKDVLLDNWSEFSKPDSEFINRQIKLAEEIQSINDSDLTNEQKVFLLLHLLAALDSIAKMFHGASIYHLVQEGINGKDQSLFKAIQIDRTVLKIPAVEKKIQTATSNGDYEYLKKIAAAQENLVTLKSVRYPKLYVVFSILMPILKHIDKHDLFDFITSFNFYSGSDESSLIKLRDAYLKRMSRKWN